MHTYYVISHRFFTHAHTYTNFQHIPHTHSERICVGFSMVATTSSNRGPPTYSIISNCERIPHHSLLPASGACYTYNIFGWCGTNTHCNLFDFKAQETGVRTFRNRGAAAAVDGMISMYTSAKDSDPWNVL
jgi:hypothetical protein